MATIPLTRGYEAIVDAADFEWLVQLSHWWANTGSNHPRAIGRVNGKQTYMHRVILNAPKGSDVDHINRDSLDNRRENLRLATRTQNNGNAVKPKQWRGRKCSSRFRGVSWVASRNVWQIGGHIKNRRISLGRSECEIEAAKIYDVWAQRYFGEFALLNFPQ